MREVLPPFAWPAIVSALYRTAAVSFDELAVAWLVSGPNKTVIVETMPVRGFRSASPKGIEARTRPELRL